MQLAPNQSNEKIVVANVQTMTGKPDVVRQVGVSVRAANGAMLAEYGALLLWWKFRKSARSTQRIPDGPRPVRVASSRSRLLKEPVLQVTLEPGSIGPAKHRHILLLAELPEGI